VEQEIENRACPGVKVLGFEGMQFKWDRDRQKWYGPISLKNLEAQQTLGKLREVERKRREYYGGGTCNGRLRSFVLCALCALCGLLP